MTGRVKLYLFLVFWLGGCLTLSAQDVPTWHTGDKWPLRRTYTIALDSDLFTTGIALSSEYDMICRGVEDMSSTLSEADDVYICDYKNGRVEVSGEMEIPGLSLRVRDIRFREGSGHFQGQAWFRRADLALVRFDIHTTGVVQATTGSSPSQKTGDLMYLDIHICTTYSPPLENVDFPLWFGEPDWFTDVQVTNSLSYDLNSQNLTDPLPGIEVDTISESQSIEETVNLSARCSYPQWVSLHGFDHCRHITITNTEEGTVFAEFDYHPDIECHVRSKTGDMTTLGMKIHNMSEDLDGVPVLSSEPFEVIVEPRTTVSGGFGVVRGWEGLATVMFPTTILRPRLTTAPYNFIAFFGPDGTPGEGEVASHGVVVEKGEDMYNVSTIMIAEDMEYLPELTIDDQEARGGDSLDFPVVLKRAHHFCAFSCDLVFDDDLVDLLEVKKGAAIAEWPSFSWEIVEKGVVCLQGFTTREKSLQGNLEIARLSFQTQPDKVGETSLTPTNLQEGLWTAYVTPGRLIVRYLILKEDIVDHLLLRTLIPTRKIPDADVNGDGIINIGDAVIMIIAD